MENVTLQTVEFKIEFVATFFSGKGMGVEREICIDNENNIMTDITGICYNSGDWIEHRQQQDRV